MSFGGLKANAMSWPHPVCIILLTGALWTELENASFCIRLLAKSKLSQISHLKKQDENIFIAFNS